jgi:hypothetical protein
MPACSPDRSFATAAPNAQLAPILQPLDKDIVRQLLRCLRAPSFQGGATLLGAIGNTGPGDARRADGLICVGGNNGF